MPFKHFLIALQFFTRCPVPAWVGFEPAWLQASVEWAARCTFSLGELRYEYPAELVPEGHTPTSWLRVLTERGLPWRYPEGVPPAVRPRTRGRGCARRRASGWPGTSRARSRASPTAWCGRPLCWK